MRKTNKKASRSDKKRETKEVEPKKKKIDRTSNEPLPLNPPAKQYVNINEYDGELSAKNKRLWAIVLILSAILIFGWLIIIKINIQRQSYDIGFDSLKQEITDTLAKFDTQVEAAKQNSPLTAGDVEQIKNNLEEQIKNNPDPSLWPSQKFAKLGISMQYPSNWKIISETAGSAMISDRASSTDYGIFSFYKLSNSSGATLDRWITRNEDLDGYRLENQTFKFSTGTPDLISYTAKTAETNKLDKLYYISSGKNVIKIKIESNGLADFYLPLAQAIISTIKTN